MAANILSPEERDRLSTIPARVDDAELVRFFTLHPADLALLSPYAKPVHHLDQAAHVCLLRWLGCPCERRGQGSVCRGATEQRPRFVGHPYRFCN